MTGSTPGGTPPPPAGPPPAGPPAGPPFALPADTAAAFLADLAALATRVHLLQSGSPSHAGLYRYDFTAQDMLNGFSRDYEPGPNNTPADDDTPP